MRNCKWDWEVGCWKIVCLTRIGEVTRNSEVWRGSCKSLIVSVLMEKRKEEEEPNVLFFHQSCIVLYLSICKAHRCQSGLKSEGLWIRFWNLGVVDPVLKSGGRGSGHEKFPISFEKNFDFLTQILDFPGKNSDDLYSRQLKNCLLSKKIIFLPFTPKFFVNLILFLCEIGYDNFLDRSSTPSNSLRPPQPPSQKSVGPWHLQPHRIGAYDLKMLIFKVKINTIPLALNIITYLSS